MKYVVMFSGGAASYEAGRRTIERVGRANVVLLFSDTLIEDPDLYRFLDQTTELLGVPLTRLADGRTPWQVFRDKRFIGNSRVDPCSKILKRDLCDKWLRDNCDPNDTVVVLGLDWTETHRIDGARGRYDSMGWRTEYPLNEAPWFKKEATLASLEEQGVPTPRLYKMGFAHNNCGGFCIKAGMGHFERLLKELPEVYAEHEAEELETQRHIGRADITVLRDRRGGQVKPMSLRDFRERVEAKTIQPDPTDIGGCGCFHQSED